MLIQDHLQVLLLPKLIKMVLICIILLGYIMHYPSVVPGVIFNLNHQPKFTSIVLTWSAPQEPNGVIISYEVTYRVSDGNLVTTNTTDLSTTFTIPSLTSGTNVTEISISAYTSVGRGDPVQIPHLVTINMPRE